VRERETRKGGGGSRPQERTRETQSTLPADRELARSSPAFMVINWIVESGEMREEREEERKVGSYKKEEGEGEGIKERERTSSRGNPMCVCVYSNSSPALPPVPPFIQKIKTILFSLTINAREIIK
jgi:hypothetical protein